MSVTVIFAALCLVIGSFSVSAVQVPGGPKSPNMSVAYSCLKEHKDEFRMCFIDAESMSEAEKCIEKLYEKLRSCYMSKMPHVSREISVTNAGSKKLDIEVASRQSLCLTLCNGACVAVQSACIAGCGRLPPIFFPVCSAACNTAATACMNACAGRC